jgi:hypothetical protein
VEQLLFVAKRKIRDAHPASRRCGRVLRAIKEYYPYGLEWGRYDGNRMYNQGLANTPLQEREWGVLGLDQNYFSARFYDPTIGRWHAVDPLEQFHSPYIAMCNDPVQQFLTAAQRRFRNANPDAIGANNIDPDGRAGTHLIDRDLCLWAVSTAAISVGLLANYGKLAAGIKNLFAMGGPLQIAVSNGAACFGAVSAGSSIGDLVDGNEVGANNCGDTDACSFKVELDEQNGNTGNGENKSGSQSDGLEKSSSGVWPGLYNIFHKGPHRTAKNYTKADLGWVTIHTNEQIQDDGEFRIAENSIMSLLPSGAMVGEDWEINGVRVDGFTHHGGNVALKLNGENISLPIGHSGFQNKPFTALPLYTSWRRGLNAFRIRSTFLPLVVNWRPFAFILPFNVLSDADNFLTSYVGAFTNARSISIKFNGPSGSSARISQVQVRVKANVRYNTGYMKNGFPTQSQKSNLRSIYDYIMFGR